MGNLARYLQNSFEARCPPDWTVCSESRFIPPAIERLLGYAPRADLLLGQKSTGRRLWIEFEVSRADPVANHAKFATSHLFAPFPKTDTFVSMVSSHIERGRRNLAAHTILLLRYAGLDAYQIPLLPTLSPARIKELNHFLINDIASVGLDADAEIDRVIQLSKPLLNMDSHKIIFASNVLEVLLNAERWNHELQTEDGQRLWKRRRGQYFVFCKESLNFAPAKFCAFVDANANAGLNSRDNPAAIGAFLPLELYASLDEGESRFDGHVARNHLVKNLAFSKQRLSDAPELKKPFEKWSNQYQESFSLKLADVIILRPLPWA